MPKEDAPVIVEGDANGSQSKHFCSVREQERPFRSSEEKETDLGSSDGEGIGKQNGIHDGVEYRNGHPVIRNGMLLPMLTVFEHGEAHVN